MDCLIQRKVLIDVKVLTFWFLDWTNWSQSNYSRTLITAENTVSDSPVLVKWK